MPTEIPGNSIDSEIKILSMRNLNHHSSNSSGTITESISVNAVRIRKAFKSYGKNNPILEDLNMTVPKGTM